MIRKLRDKAPGIIVNVIASDKVRDVLQREADIAIRHTQPIQPDLIARRVGSLTGHIYASQRLLDEVGVPSSFGDLVGKDFIGIENTEELIANISETVWIFFDEP